MKIIFVNIIDEEMNEFMPTIILLFKLGMKMS